MSGMSIIGDINAELRIEAIRTLLQHHPRLQDELLLAEGKGFINTKATPEELCLVDPGDILVRLAWDIWNGGGESELEKVFTQLSPDDFEAFVEAMVVYGKLRNKIRGMHASGLEND